MIVSCRMSCMRRAMIYQLEALCEAGLLHKVICSIAKLCAAIRWRAADPPVLQVAETDVRPRREARALRDAVRQTDVGRADPPPASGQSHGVCS